MKAAQIKLFAGFLSHESLPGERLGVPAEVVVHLDAEALPVRSNGRVTECVCVLCRVILISEKDIFIDNTTLFLLYTRV